jgi:hypothetical protein
VPRSPAAPERQDHTDGTTPREATARAHAGQPIRVRRHLRRRSPVPRRRARTQDPPPAPKTLESTSRWRVRAVLTPPDAPDRPRTGVLPRLGSWAVPPPGAADRDPGGLVSRQARGHETDEPRAVEPGSALDAQRDRARASVRPPPDALTRDAAPRSSVSRVAARVPWRPAADVGLPPANPAGPGPSALEVLGRDLVEELAELADLFLGVAAFLELPFVGRLDLQPRAVEHLGRGEQRHVLQAAGQRDGV